MHSISWRINVTNMKEYWAPLHEQGALTKIGGNDNYSWCHCKEKHWLEIHLAPFRAYYHSISSSVSEIQIQCKPTASVLWAPVIIPNLWMLDCSVNIAPPHLKSFVQQSYDWAVKEIQSHYKLLASVNQLSSGIGFFQMTPLLNCQYKMFRALILNFYKFSCISLI